MIRHVVVFTWDDEARPDQIQAMADAMRTLPDAIDELRHYEVGPDLGLADGNDHFAVVADVDDRDAYVTYRDHPAHRAVIAQHVAPIMATRHAVQYEIP